MYTKDIVTERGDDERVSNCCVSLRVPRSNATAAPTFLKLRRARARKSRKNLAAFFSLSLSLTRVSRRKPVRL